MKTLNTQRVIAAICLLTIFKSSFAQVDTRAIVQQKFDAIQAEFPAAIANDELMNEGALNAFFAKQVSSYLSKSSDIILTNTYALLDASDGRLFIGGSMNNRNSKTDRLRFVTQAGIKANVKNGFSTIYKSGKYANDLGLSFKFSYIGKGTVSMINEGALNQQQKLVIERAKILSELQAEQTEKLERVSESLELNAFVESEEAQRNKIQSLIDNNATSIVKEYFDKEANFVIQEENYTWSKIWWISLDGYYPVTESKYNFAASANSATYTEEGTKPYYLNFIYTRLYTSPKYGKLYLSAIAGIEGNNVVNAGIAGDPESFVTIVNQGGNNNAITETEEVYVGDFQEFNSQKWGGEVTYFFPKKWSFVGLSASVSKITSNIEYDTVNWKIGMPFSLKDSEGKSKVNFEVQWREQFKNHSIGISVGIPFGSIIY